MLNLIATAEGYGQELVIGTLYYSGCALWRHVSYLTNDTPAYSLYLSSTATPEKPPVILKDYTMKDALLYDDWDIIIMQGGAFEIAEDKTYTKSEKDKKHPPSAFSCIMKSSHTKRNKRKERNKNITQREKKHGHKECVYNNYVRNKKK